MRNVLGRAVLLLATVVTALLLTPATAAAQCTGGLVNTLTGQGSRDCGGIYPAVGSAAALVVALAAIGVHATISYARGGADRLDARTGIDPTPESIAHGTVRMEEHPDFPAEIARIGRLGFTIVAVTGAPGVVIRRVVEPTGKIIRTDLELQVRPGMRYLDLEHELGHIGQVFDPGRFPDGPKPTDIVTPNRGSPTGYVEARVQDGVLTTEQNAIMEYHNRLQELIWLDERGAPLDVMREHLDGVYGSATESGWYGRYRRTIFGGEASSTVRWQLQHFGDLQELARRVAPIRTRVLSEPR